MKDEKKVNKAEEEAKKEVQTEEKDGKELTDEQLSDVNGGYICNNEKLINMLGL